MGRARLVAAALLAFGLATTSAAQAQSLEDLTKGGFWGETSGNLLRRLGGAATVLPQPLDFGDSYVDLVLRHVPLGGYDMIAYFQMDKTSGRLKRIQLERPRHAVNPPVFRATAAALETAYGAP